MIRGIIPSPFLNISSLKNRFSLLCQGKSLSCTLGLAILNSNPLRWGDAYLGDFVNLGELVRYGRAFFEVNLDSFCTANLPLNLLLSRPSLSSTSTRLHTVTSPCRTCLWMWLYLQIRALFWRAFEESSANTPLLTLKLQSCQLTSLKVQQNLREPLDMMSAFLQQH